MDSAWRLLWALPLVFTVGIVAMLVMRRFVAPISQAVRSTQRMRVRESLTVSDHTRLHLVEIDGKVYAMTESSQHSQLQLLTAIEVQVPSWLKRLQKASR